MDTCPAGRGALLAPSHTRRLHNHAVRARQKIAWFDISQLPKSRDADGSGKFYSVAPFVGCVIEIRTVRLAQPCI